MVRTAMILLVTITLAEMMFAMGLQMNHADLRDELQKNRWLIFRAMVVNFLVFPVLVFLIIIIFRVPGPVAAGFLILAVLPAAPYGLPFTRIAKGNMAIATVLMFILATSSAIIAPVLLFYMLPLVSSAATTIAIDLAGLAGNLFLIQLLPLVLGVFMTWWRPALASRLIKPAGLISKVLNTLFISIIIIMQFNLPMSANPKELMLMLLVTIAGIIIGWVSGGPGKANRISVMMVTAMRNMSLAIGIATTSFPGTPVSGTVLAYSFVSGTGLLICSLVLRKYRPGRFTTIKRG